MMGDLAERMIRYEDTYRQVLPFRMPVIVRVDGKAFHSLTRGCDVPFDIRLGHAMDWVANQLLAQMQNARMAYVQSDEVSVLMVDYNRFGSQPWFGGVLQKIVSVSASIAAVSFTEAWGRAAYFDSRAFAIPERDVANYFVYRQQDATRNSIQMATRALYSHKQVHGKNTDEMQEMMYAKGVNWNDYSAYWKRGRVVTLEGVDAGVPIFAKDPAYLAGFLAVEQE